MMLKAVGLKPRGRLPDAIVRFSWRLIQWRRRRLMAQAAAFARG